MVVNISDLLSTWTNGYVRSTVHRVVLTNPSVDSSGTQRSDKDSSGLGEIRFSIATFVQPHADAELVSAPSSLTASQADPSITEVVGYGGGILSAK